MNSSGRVVPCMLLTAPYLVSQVTAQFFRLSLFLLYVRASRCGANEGRRGGRIEGRAQYIFHDPLKAPPELK